MAKQVKFYSVANLPENADAGALYFVDGGELYKGAQRFGLGRVTVAASTTGITGMARGDIVVTGNGAGWVYDDNAWRSIGGDTTSLQSMWRADISASIAGLVLGDEASYITYITSQDGKVQAHAKAFPTLGSGTTNGTVKLGEGADVKVSGWDDLVASVGANTTSITGLSTKVSTLEDQVSGIKGIVDVSNSKVTATTGSFTNLNVTGTADFTATTVEATNLTVNGSTVEQIADKQIGAIAAVTKTGESNGVTVNVTTKAGSVETVAVTTAPVEAIATSGEGSDTVVSEKAVKAYVDGKFTALDNAMHFLGVGTVEKTEDGVNVTPPAGKIPVAGDIVIDSTTGLEAIYTGTKWELIGDNAVYALNAYTSTATVYSGVETVPAALNAAGAAIDTINGKVSTLESAVTGGSDSYTGAGVTVSVDTAAKTAKPTVQVTIDANQLNAALGTSGVVDKSVATTIGDGSDTDLATTSAVKAYTDTEVKKVTDAFTGGTNANGDAGVNVSVTTAAKSAAPTVTVTVTKDTLNTTLGTTAVADKTIATSIGATGVDTALATEQAVREAITAAITAAELVWLNESGTPIA